MRPKVVNVRDFKPRQFIYVGRYCRSWGLAGHPLANPFKLSPAHASERHARRHCLQQYREWLDALPNKDALLQALAAQVKEMDVPLACWCAPLACHADVLAELIEEALMRQVR